jgi:hypothetical protein
MTVPAGHLGGHLLFDWNTTADIDVFNIWNNSTGGTWQNVVAGGELYQGPAGPTPALNTLYEWISVDGDGDGIPGIQFVDCPFILCGVYSVHQAGKQKRLAACGRLCCLDWYWPTLAQAPPIC